MFMVVECEGKRENSKPADIDVGPGNGISDSANSDRLVM
jgi:hypothetical protein